MTDLFEAETTTTTTLDMRRLQRMQRRATRRKWTLVLSAVGLVLLAVGASTALNFVKDTFATEEDLARTPLRPRTGAAESPSPRKSASWTRACS
jgi:UPF0755 protein